MSDIIDLAAERNKRTAPAPEFLKQDDEGRDMQLYTVAYEMDGERWGFDVWAYSFDDAEKRVRAIRQSAELSGQVYERGPA